MAALADALPEVLDPVEILAAFIAGGFGGALFAVRGARLAQVLIAPHSLQVKGVAAQVAVGAVAAEGAVCDAGVAGVCLFVGKLGWGAFLAFLGDRVEYLEQLAVFRGDAYSYTSEHAYKDEKGGFIHF